MFPTNDSMLGVAVLGVVWKGWSTVVWYGVTFDFTPTKLSSKVLYHMWRMVTTIW